MANSLERDIKQGDKLVVNLILHGKSVVIATGGGFGARPYTSGTAVFVEFAGQTLRIEGPDILAEETMRRFGKKNGWVAAESERT